MKAALTGPAGSGARGTIGDDVERALWAAVERAAPTLVDLSHALHADPELSGDEHRAAERVRRILAGSGFRLGPQPGAPTALCAESGEGGLVVVLCVEYDALPGIGHACGHNVNAAAAVGAALALAELADALGITVRVLGTPAEESYGGKVDLLEEGWFDGAGLALMAHAGGEDIVGGGSLALGCWDAVFTGHPAHAAAAPHEGRNALDALVVAQTAVALARQQLPPGVVVSLVVTDGGDAPHVSPARAAARFEIRARDLAALESARARVLRCFEAGAHAAGCDLEIERRGHVFGELRQDGFLSAAYAEAMRRRGRAVRHDPTPVASTDMGNVSHAVPSIHPLVGYEVDGAVHHTPDFARHGNSPSADRAVLDAAFGLASAAAAAALDPEQRARLGRPASLGQPASGRHGRPEDVGVL